MACRGSYARPPAPSRARRRPGPGCRPSSCAYARPPGSSRRKAAAETAVGFQVHDRPDRPDQLGKDFDLQPQLLRPVEKIAFGPFGRPGDQGDIIVISMVQPLDGQERILLGAADDQPGDDVDDSHAVAGG